uniref:MYND-type domain-containing protein n=1 Tax=Arcella intermedia TaxID=1963864 RepID=A0A6B2LJE1_9EUKA
MKEKGNEQLKKGNFSKAVEFYSTAINIDEQNHILWSNRSLAYANQSLWSEALADANKTLFLAPNFAKGYLRKGVALAGLGKYEEAKVVLAKGSHLDPKNQEIKEAEQRVIYQSKLSPETKPTTSPKPAAAPATATKASPAPAAKPATASPPQLGNTCSFCNKQGVKLSLCSICKSVQYCNKDCQRSHWPKHKPNCKKV